MVYFVLLIIFHIIYFAALIVFSVLAWKQKRKNEIISYVFLMILGAVQAFDKDDKYFYIQLIVLVVFLIGLILQWKKNNKKETV